mmetsp:Transcript_54600/g.145853  ORF Transcript_54600/g.145853 Transcript_54600/m.145853 type:complete len:236 (-) Transcript_54600:2396-3103(-)
MTCVGIHIINVVEKYSRPASASCVVKGCASAATSLDLPDTPSAGPLAVCGAELSSEGPQGTSEVGPSSVVVAGSEMRCASSRSPSCEETSHTALASEDNSRRDKVGTSRNPERSPEDALRERELADERRVGDHLPMSTTSLPPQAVLSVMSSCNMSATLQLDIFASSSFSASVVASSLPCSSRSLSTSLQCTAAEDCSMPTLSSGAVWDSVSCILTEHPRGVIWALASWRSTARL